MNIFNVKELHEEIAINLKSYFVIYKSQINECTHKNEIMTLTDKAAAKNKLLPFEFPGDDQVQQSSLW